jgi:hypothetical protein
MILRPSKKFIALFWKNCQFEWLGAGKTREINRVFLNDPDTGVADHG